MVSLKRGVEMDFCYLRIENEYISTTITTLQHCQETAEQPKLKGIQLQINWQLLGLV